ncbi:MAG: diguanylate cyclase, partial [Oscillospiraceae bacterium]
MAESLLIVGKNNRNRTILKRALSSIYEVIEAVGIGVALDILYAEKIRAIFIDTFESENASMDFLKIVRGQKRYLSLPIFVMISENNEGLEIKALSMGATDFFFSTFNPALLLNRVKNEFEKQLAIESAKRDNLTGVYNRYGLESNIDLSILYNGGKRKMALGIIDIDNFKAVNDTYGHKFGDKAL